MSITILMRTITTKNNDHIRLEHLCLFKGFPLGVGIRNSDIFNPTISTGSHLLYGTHYTNRRHERTLPYDLKALLGRSFRMTRKNEDPR